MAKRKIVPIQVAHAVVSDSVFPIGDLFGALGWRCTRFGVAKVFVYLVLLTLFIISSGFWHLVLWLVL